MWGGGGGGVTVYLVSDPAFSLNLALYGGDVCGEGGGRGYSIPHFRSSFLTEFCFFTSRLVLRLLYVSRLSVCLSTYHGR